MDLFEFENTSAQDAELVSKVVDLLSMAIEQHGSASLVVSGGRTPKGFFHLLSSISFESLSIALVRGTFPRFFFFSFSNAFLLVSLII